MYLTTETCRSSLFEIFIMPHLNKKIVFYIQSTFLTLRNKILYPVSLRLTLSTRSVLRNI